MKCLENLSLVDDDCVEDLKKDIEALIASYIDLNAKCKKLIDDIYTEKPSVPEIHGLTRIFDKFSRKIFNGESSFYNEPVWVKSIIELSDAIIEDESDAPCRQAEIGLRAVLAYEDKVKTIENGYWVYREGANWELEIETTKELFQYFKDIISCASNKELIKLYRELKECYEELIE